MNHNEHPAVEQNELSMGPMELLSYRLNRANLGMSQLQQLNNNAITAMQKDIVFALLVIEKISDHLPKEQMDQIVVEALPAYGQRQQVQDNVLETPAPIQHGVIPAAGNTLHLNRPTRDIREAARVAQAALGEVGAELQRRQEGTRIQPAAINRGPTREGVARATLSRGAQPQDFVGHFLGNGSLFTKFLSPTVLHGGKGFVEPNYGSFVQYNEDAMQISPPQLQANGWPSGFYRDRGTRLQQLFLTNEKIQVLVTNLPNPEYSVFVSMEPFSGRTDIRSLSLIDMKRIYGMIQSVFENNELGAVSQA